MALRQIPYDAIPLLFLDSPPHSALEVVALSLARYLRNYAAALFFYIDWMFLVEGEAAGDYYDGQAVLMRYEKETKGQGACVVKEGVLAAFGELVKIYEDVFGSGGHATLDWGHWFRVQERGLEEH